MYGVYVFVYVYMFVHMCVCVCFLALGCLGCFRALEKFKSKRKVSPMWLLEQLSQKFLVWPWPWVLGKTIHVICVTPADCTAIGGTALIWQDLVGNTNIIPTFIHFNFCLFWRKDIKTFCHPTDSSWILNLSGPCFFVHMQVKTWPIFNTISRSQGLQFRWLFLCEKYQQAKYCSRRCEGDFESLGI